MFARVVWGVVSSVAAECHTPGANYLELSGGNGCNVLAVRFCGVH